MEPSQQSDESIESSSPSNGSRNSLRYPVEDYFQLLSSDKDARYVLVLPAINALGDLYLKEAVSTWKELMHFYVGFPDNTRLVICTQDQILQKFMDDRKPEAEVISASESPTCEEKISDKIKPTKRPSLPLYVSPALRNSPKQTKSLTEKESKESKAEAVKCDSRVPPKQIDIVQPEEDTSWKQLTPSQLEEIYDMLGNVDLIKPQLDECPNEMKATLKEDALSHIIEVFNMNKEIKTKDIMSVFDTYNGLKNHLKWVDDERALLIFSTPDLAKEALKVSHPVIQTRLIEIGSPESKGKILTCSSSSNLLPWKARPKTVTTLARRLISSQLGPEFQNVSPEVLKKESKLLREAMAEKSKKEKERLARRLNANGNSAPPTATSAS